ncbi:hypothetical protein, partial [Streptomyces albospinus]|uniref:hypothetical protein n=1 Tax=Streptomyces albospinus TaxID=285515 RepID=UPI001E5E71BF
MSGQPAAEAGEDGQGLVVAGVFAKVRTAYEPLEPLTAGSMRCDRSSPKTPSTLEVISFGESAVADEGAGDAGEGEEVVGFALVA